MKRIQIFIAAIVLGGALQSCSTMEITQSRYGNGIGVAFGNGSGVNEQDAQHFRDRKSDEINHKKWLGHTSAMLARKGILEKAPALEIENNSLAMVEIPAFANQKIIVDEVAYHKIAENPLSSIIQTEKTNHIVAHPVEAEKTAGDTTNLGYIGGVLIVIGLILFILGYGAAISLVVLGVILIIIAYFLG